MLVLGWTVPGSITASDLGWDVQRQDTQSSTGIAPYATGVYFLSILPMYVTLLLGTSATVIWLVSMHRP